MSQLSTIPSAAAATPTAAAPARRSAALDGIRFLGSAFIVSYHAGYVWAEGGILAVSTFFTLSGFLITRGLMKEHRSSGRISLKTFYKRRVQRLLPSALVVFLGVAVFWAVFPGRGRAMSFASFFWALFYGSNLHLLSQDSSYMNLFADASPLQHTWSLSIEEQIYFVIPLLLIVVLGRAAWKRHVNVALGAVAALSFLAAWYLAGPTSNDRAYYATEARAGEFLLGSMLAVFWVTSPLVPRVVAFFRSTVGNVVGLLLFAIDMALWFTATIEGHNLFRGLTIVNGLLICAVIAVSCSDSPEYTSGHRPLLSIILGWRPLVAIGKRAYAIYLVHWPVILFVDRFRGRTAGLQLFAVRIALTLIVVELLYQFIERPVMEQRRLKGPNLYRACALLAGAGLVVATFVASPASASLVDPAALVQQQANLAALPQYTVNDPIRSTVDDAAPSRLLLIGDSQSWTVSIGLKELWAVDHGVRVESVPGVGCGVGELGPIKYLGDTFEQGRPGCREWQEFIPKTLDRYLPPLVVVIGGFADVCDRQIDADGDGQPDGVWTHIGEPAYDEWMLRQMNEFADLVSSTGARVLWFTSPPNDPPNPPGIESFPEEDPARMARYNELIQQVADSRDDVDTADLATMVINRPDGAFEPQFRPDGAHMDLRHAPDVLAFITEAIETSMRNVR